MRRGLGWRPGRTGWWLVVVFLGLVGAGWHGAARSQAGVQEAGFGPPARLGAGSPLAELEFTKPDLYLSTSNLPLDEARGRLPGRRAWDEFLTRLPPGTQVHIDPRSGAASGIVTRVPLLPGDGDGNHVTFEEIEATLGRPLTMIDSQMVGELTLRFIRRNAAALGINPSQLGRPTASLNGHLWHVSVPQEVQGVPVRGARVLATISRGNLILLGTESWGDVRKSAEKQIDSDEALRLGYEYAGGADPADQILRQPRLEFWPAAPEGWDSGPGGIGAIGKGYTHLLVWVFDFLRPPGEESWQVAIDAVSGEVVSFSDLNTYARRKIKGGVYPAASNGVGPCPGPVCGILQPGYPMPWADTGLPTPDDFTSSAGVFDYTGGTVTTTLTGKYVVINDKCGTISVGSPSGDIDLGGSNGDKDCIVPPGTSPGNTASARTVFYEFNKIAEIGRSWLPSNTWLQSTQDITTNFDLAQACNASFNTQGKFTFYKTMTAGEACSRCNSPGQSASIIDHEFAHGLDMNDATPGIGNFGEGFADIVAAYRQQQSCIGYGMRTEPQCEPGEYQFCLNPEGAPLCPDRCGLAQDGLYNAYENLGFTGVNPNPGPHCTTDCSGGRDLDYARHADGIPDTPQNFVCSECPVDNHGPCKRDKYCAMAPMRQAAWDLATRDLPAQHGYDLNTSFIVASRILYQSAKNTSSWHACNCGAGTSDGCGSNSGYNQWLAADDDDGNPLNGTPHMVAIYNAFNRHNIACTTPTVQNGGCSGGPDTSPTLTVQAECGSVDLSWSSVPGAFNYQVFRTEGHNGCDLGKALVAVGPQTSHLDTAVADGREYSYMVVPMTGTPACVGPGSACFAATPLPITGDPVVTVNWPNGGAVLFVNTAVNLAWTATDDCGGVASVDLHLSRNGPGGPFEPIALDIPNTGTYNWVVTGPPTSNAFLKVTARDPEMNTGTDLSDAASSISSGCGPCIVSWCKEEALRCTWNSTCGPGACCNYTCSYDPSCTGIDECPENACSC